VPRARTGNGTTRVTRSQSTIEASGGWHRGALLWVKAKWGGSLGGLTHLALRVEASAAKIGFLCAGVVRRVAVVVAPQCVEHNATVGVHVAYGVTADNDKYPIGHHYNLGRE